MVINGLWSCMPSETHFAPKQAAPADVAGSAIQSELSRRERRGLETRERLFRAALAKFAQKGFTDTTIEDITEAADLGKGTFFNYFPSKDHLLMAFAEM